VVLLADPDSEALATLKEAELSVELVVDRRRPQVFIAYNLDDSALVSNLISNFARANSIVAKHDWYANYDVPHHGRSPLHHKGVLDISMFCLLADLWNHTRKYKASTKSDLIFVGPARQRTTENETAASLPGDTAAPNQSQPNIAKQRSGTSETSEVTPKRKISQRAFGRAATGHSTSIQERPVHDPPQPPDSATVRAKRPKR
jgi:hypothetical protein